MCLQPACMAGCGETATRRAEIHDWEQEIPFAQQIARQNLRVAQRFLKGEFLCEPRRLAMMRANTSSTWR